MAPPAAPMVVDAGAGVWRGQAAIPHTQSASQMQARSRICPPLRVANRSQYITTGFGYR